MLSLVYIIPGLTCLFWAGVHCLLTPRTRTFKILLILLIALFLDAVCDVFFGSRPQWESVAHIFVQFLSPALIPLVCLYFLHLQKPLEYKPRHWLWIALPVMQATAAILLTSINGLEETSSFLTRLHSGYTGEELFLNGTEHTYYIWTVVIFRIVMALEVLFFIGFCGVTAVRLHFHPANLYKFLFKQKSIRTVEIQMIIALLITLLICIKLYSHVMVYQGHPIIAVCIALTVAVLKYFFGFFALFGAKTYVSRKEISTALRFNYRENTRSKVAEEVIMDMADYLNGESLTHVISRIGTQSDGDSLREAGGKSGGAPSLATAIFSAVSKSWEEGSLVTRFQHMMIDEEAFLQPGLSLSDVADHLNTNKTYVSKMVNQTYNLGFPELLNILRVDYAEQYIVSHTDSTQEEIARACGFVSASSFNSTFKRITGYTPRVWAARKASTSGQ